MTNYERWNRALCGRFLQQNDAPLYLYTDRAVIEEVASDAGVDTTQATEAFLEAVVSTLGGAEPFERWARVARSTNREEQPPYLAVLCFLVYVAVERAETKFQYYPDLNRHLCLRGHGAPPGFDHHVPSIFRHFNEWLVANDGRFGAPTAKEHAHFTNIGWPLSQALVRPSDRGLLVRLFREAGIRPAQRISGAQLHSMIRRPLLTAADTPSKTRLTTLDNDHPEVFRAVVEQEYQAWNGSVSLTGMQRLRLRLAYEPTCGEWWFATLPVPELDALQWRVGNVTGKMRRAKGVYATPSDLWSLVGAGDVGEIEHGPTLTSPPRAHRWLSIDRGVGGWVEVLERDLNADQFLLLSDPLPIDPPAPVQRHNDAPAGRTMYMVPSGVELDLPTEAGAKSTSSRKPRLSGGLILRAATNTYLWCSTGVPEIAGVDDLVQVDGSPAVKAVEGTASLRDLALPPGQHTAVTNSGDLRFTLLRDLTKPPVVYEESWIDSVPDGDRVAVPHTDGDVWLVGPNGEAERRRVHTPRWLGDLDLYSNEVEMTGMVTNCWFKPAYVIADSYMGKPHVIPVPAALAIADADAEHRPIDIDAARRLVTRLIVGCGPDERRSDKAWKRCLAELMRSVNR
ncbi:hypothetical protein WBG06_26460 [Nocardioides sp. CCNWLW239]|uniref:hypothetical protein n=1 Tax=Nocardioides sp. CCNWLW239 TaxID=3128902 RepID=UPI00301927BE